MYVLKLCTTKTLVLRGHGFTLVTKLNSINLD
jgi:hypothetical protein